jgi:hypothetical protein
MLGALWRLLAYRFLGARIMLALTVFGWLRRFLGSRRTDSKNRPTRSAARDSYQPSQGSSQMVHREPR